MGKARFQEPGKPAIMVVDLLALYWKNPPRLIALNAEDARAALPVLAAFVADHFPNDKAISPVQEIAALLARIDELEANQMTPKHRRIIDWHEREEQNQR